MNTLCCVSERPLRGPLVPAGRTVAARQFALLTSLTVMVAMAAAWWPSLVMAQTPERVMNSPELAEDRIVDFDWMQHRVTVADLSVDLNLPFQHGKPDLDSSEVAAYRELVLTINERRYAAQFNAAGEAQSEAATENAWESAFYKYEAARRQAWLNGQLELRPLPNAATDPFEGPRGTSANQRVARLNTRVPYSLQADISTFPDDYVGRPVVMYGMYVSSGQFEIPVSENTAGIDQPAIRLQRGLLKDLLNSRTLAIVDAAGYIGPGNQLQSLERWPSEPGVAVPVLVKGWFIKRWGQYPLIMTQAVRILHPRPYDELIQAFVRPRTPLMSEEKWLYYETLRQLQLTSESVQRKLANNSLKDRIHVLMNEIRDKAANDQTLLQRDVRRQKITEEQFRRRQLTVQRQLAFRLDRYRGYFQDLRRFPLYVDVFQNPDKWTGKLVTLQGHVRRTTSYQGDEELFAGQQLHELWLFTDDSQHNPAVIITPSLPQDFPVAAEVVDRVTVTGCFFKPYVYRAEGDHRVAPLILCGRIHWSPTDDQIHSLAAEGALAGDSALVIAARRRSQSNKLSDTGVMLLGFLSLIIMMMIWGRVQRDRRERRRVLDLIATQQDFDQHLIDPVLTRFGHQP